MVEKAFEVNTVPADDPGWLSHLTQHVEHDGLVVFEGSCMTNDPVDLVSMVGILLDQRRSKNTPSLIPFIGTVLHHDRLHLHECLIWFRRVSLAFISRNLSSTLESCSTPLTIPFQVSRSALPQVHRLLQVNIGNRYLVFSAAVRHLSRGLMVLVAWGGAVRSLTVYGRRGALKSFSRWTRKALSLLFVVTVKIVIPKPHKQF